MESLNLSSNGSDASIIEVPLFVTYLKMLLVLVMSVLIITPAVIVIRVIRKTDALHTNYYFFVANLLVTDIVQAVIRLITENLIMIIYLLDINTDTAGEVVFWLNVPLSRIFFLLTNFLFVTLAMERVIVIGYPYRHRSIMTTKVVCGMIVTIWVVSVILAVVVIATSPYSVQWPFGTIVAERSLIRAIILLPLRIASAAFIIASNIFLFYKVHQSNKKAEENMRMGSSGEEETKRLNKLVQMLRLQTKTAISLLMLGGIEGISNVLVPVMHMLFKRLGLTGELYATQFLSYIMHGCIRLSHSLIYGFYMKQIRERLPKCNIQPCPQFPRRSRVVTLN